MGRGTNLGKAQGGGSVTVQPQDVTDSGAVGGKGTGKVVWGLLKCSEDKDAEFVL